MKKMIRSMEKNLYEILGEEVVNDRSVGFKVSVGVLVLSVSGFILFNLVQLIFNK